MIKRTLYFGNPAYLSLKDNQLVVNLAEPGASSHFSSSEKENSKTTIPVEDIGIVVLDHQQITVTHGLIQYLLDYNCSIITCNGSHLPTGMVLPLDGNNIQNERFRIQLDASIPLKKQLWQQTIQCKISNQAKLLKLLRDQEVGNMIRWANDVRSGDPDNLEARAAVYYWRNFFPSVPNFIRGRDMEPPNNLLNYGYAILRATMARALVGAGLMPTLGIHHHNKYNAYCLADDIMEPYRPYVDHLVAKIIDDGEDYTGITKDLKRKLLSIPTIEVRINGQRSPLMVATTTTATSLYRCFNGEIRKISYPEM